jgi:Mrp family chromosome partitioning ATPase
VFALAGLFSVLAAVVVTQSRNDAIPEHEAVVAVTFNRLLGEVDDTLAQERLNTAEQIATVVNFSDLATSIDPLAPGVRAEVIATESDLRLLFIGRGATREEASSVATTMRDRYLAAQQLDISQEFAQRIADTAARLDQVLVAIAIATPPPDVDGIEANARMRELQAEVVALAALYGQYTAELIEPRNPPRGQATILADRDAASEALRVAQDELSSLEFAIGGTTVHDIDLALLVAEEAQLRAALDTYMALSISDEPIAIVGSVEVSESGIPPTPLPVAVVVGLLVGLLIGIAGLVFVDRVRQPLWEPTELDPRYRLPEVAARPRSLGDSAKPWYETAPYSRRKAGIQELRSAVEGLPGFGDGVVVGVASLTGPSPHVHELAADLAAGLASSGSWALLIDADYGQPSDLLEYRRHGFELEDVMADPQGTLIETADSADRDRDFLGVAISKRSADAADLLAKPAFAHMLDAAQAMHDVVIVACPPTESASYHVLSQRLDAMILVATAGDPSPADVVNVLRTLEERRSVPAGVVLIRPRVGPISLIMNQIKRPLPTPDPAPVQEFEWQWSEGNHARRGGDVTRAVSQEPGPPAEGIGSEGFETATALVPTQSGFGAAALAADSSREQHDLADQPATGDGEVATRTERIKRRAFRRRNADKAPTNDRKVDGSPWSYRDGSE